MADSATIQRTYPWTTTINGTELTFRLMTPGDRDAILDFARSLPNEDLMFLRTDITEPKTVDTWMAQVKAGRSTTVVAEADGKIAGYATIHTNDALWTRHVGELRVLVDRNHRGLPAASPYFESIGAIRRRPPPSPGSPQGQRHADAASRRPGDRAIVPSFPGGSRPPLTEVRRKIGPETPLVGLRRVRPVCPR